ncbi:mechanosensitive ion channel family protein [Rhabdaerophilum sp. SD176]|uniref:mechanosensitive ion channel family protein n=1 Tax=Rhabdaerophilum sp. SD176 TaxID=2983548 RepID=UPI0024E006A4|nr:mechanosensitive ion channel family protein [Rhabdaerophilum sp. SD176]
MDAKQWHRFWPYGPSVWVALLLAVGPALAAEGSRPSGGMGLVPALHDIYSRIQELFWPILVAMPTIGSELVKAGFAFAADRGHPLWTGLLSVIGVLAAMALTARLVRAAALRWFDPASSLNPASRVIRRFLVDVAGALALAVTALAGAELIASGAGLVASLLRSLIDLALLLGIVLIVPSALFRPGEPQLRLVEADDSQIRAAAPFAIAGVLAGISFPTLIPVWLEAGMSWPAGQAMALIIGSIVASLGYLAAIRYSRTMTADIRIRSAATTLAILFWLAWSYGVVALDFPFYFLMIRLAAVSVGGFLLDRVIAYAIRSSRLDPPGPDRISASEDDEAPASENRPVNSFWQNYGQPLRRVIWFGIGAAALLVCSGWLVEVVPDIFGEGRMSMMRGRLAAALLTLGIGYVIFEGLSAWTRTRYAANAKIHKPGGDDDGLAPASRLETIVPIFQGLIGVFVLGVTALSALSQLGIDITPILAGAGILGLAVSFGSQSLVRDVVAGIFFMIDDAFRLGEYIEAGRLKGAVERISVRSVQLRHHNGFVHTVPFGQLGSITNYSRDWITMKFNLRLSRDIEIDKVRKTVKAIGLELLEDPEYGKEFILPLKMQGVADILDNALLIRFKFTVRPGKPTYVQREAIKRIIRVFQEKGIEFAKNSVIIENSAEREEPDDPAAAIAAMKRPAAAQAGPPA